MTNSASSPSFAQKLKKILPLVLILSVICVFFLTGAHNYISEDALKENHEFLTNLVTAHPVIMPLAFIGLYFAVVLFSLPGGSLMSVTGGFLFGPFYGGFLVVLGATFGATGLFLAAKTSIGDSLKQKAGPWMDKLAAGFKENEFSYLLFLRLVPAFPFFVVNLVPAFLGVSLKNYVIGTFIGILPATLVFTYFGAGLGEILKSGEDFSLSSIVTAEILIALGGLAILSLLPIIIKKIKAQKTL